MNVKLSDLKKWPKVYAMAKRNHHQHDEGYEFPNDKDKNLTLDTAFMWAYAEEGSYELWRHIYQGRVSEAKELHPELFE